MYNCAQYDKRQRKSQKVDETKKQRDKEKMSTFACRGWLHITITDQSNVALVKIDHHNDHIPYFPIDIPPEVKQYVHDNTNMTPTQVHRSKSHFFEARLLIAP